MIWAVVSLGPIVVALAIALVLFAGWAALMIRADRTLEHRLAAEASSPLAAVRPIAQPVVEPVVAVVTSVPRAPTLVAVEEPAPASAHEGVHEDVWEQLAEPAAAPEPVVVRSGSFCTVVGATGVTAAGTEMVCTAIEGARPRWRRAERELARTR